MIVPLAEAGFEVHGIDLSDNMLAVCRRKVNEKLVDIFRDYEKNPSDGTGKIIAVVRRPN